MLPAIHKRVFRSRLSLGSPGDQMIRCRTCTMPNTRPDTPFVDGECAACRSYRLRHEIDWHTRRNRLCELLDKHHGRVIVPSSGGKDSTYQALTLKAMGADVTCVTARTCHLTEIGRRNIDNLARHCRTIEVTPDMTVRAVLNRIALETVGDISWPEHAAIFSTPFKVAIDLGESLIMYGENPQNAYGGPLGTEDAMTMTRRWITEFGGFLGLRPMDFVGQEGITERDMRDYQPPTERAMFEAGIEAHFLGQYIPWNSHLNAVVAQQAGMRSLGYPPSIANWWEWENLDNAQTGIHDLFMRLKYGFGRGCQQISVDVRTGRVDRAFALDWVESNDAAPFTTYADVPMSHILSRIGMTRREFEAC